MQGDLVTVVGRHLLTVRENVRGAQVHVKLGGRTKPGGEDEGVVVVIPERYVNFRSAATPLAPDQGEVVDRAGITRKSYYGPVTNEQPWDSICRRGWGAAFCGANILKYLRRVKSPDDLEKARWYWVELNKLTRVDSPQERAWGAMVLGQLLEELNSDEIIKLVPISEFPDGAIDPNQATKA